MCSLGQFSLFFLPDGPKQPWEEEALKLLLSNKAKKACSETWSLGYKLLI